MSLLKFTQREIIEIKEISTSLKVPMTFEQRFDNSIYFDFANNKSIHSILKKSSSGYRMDYTNSDGQSNYYSNKDWYLFKRQLGQWAQKIKRDNPIEFYQYETIEFLSKEYYPTYKEADIILNLGFPNSAGMIFRKALEILVKDFLLYHLPVSFHNDIFEQTIGRIIFSFYRKEGKDLIIREEYNSEPINSKLLEIQLLTKKINNTFKIGNDFSHYERRLIEFSSDDMKNNLDKIVHFIDSKLQVENFKNQQSKLNNEFDSERLI